MMHSVEDPSNVVKVGVARNESFPSQLAPELIQVFV
jgi:hypothetical protein